MIKKEEFILRRNKFSNQMKPNSVAIFFSKESIIKGDSEHFDFCDTNLFYLTGVETSGCKFLVYKDENQKVSEYFFFEEQDERSKLFEGEKLNIENFKKKSGINNIINEKEFQDKFNSLDFDNVYIFENPRKSNLKGKTETKLFKEKIESKHNILNSFEILRDLRSIKSQDEIEQIKKAIKVTEEGFDNVLKNLKEYSNEADIEAILTYTYTKNKTKHSYQPIVGSGENSCILHYIKNNQDFGKSNIVLIDSGCEYENYKSDITRTYPISGKFSKREKEVYQATLEIQKFALTIIKEGIKYRDYELKILEFVQKKLIGLNLIEEDNLELKENIKKIRKYYPHSTSHFLGLDTHDIGDYEKEFQENQIITVEPGIYINEEKIGVRIEDNILVKKNHCEVLSGDIPKEIEDISN